MKNQSLVNAIRFYNIRDIDSFNTVFNELVENPNTSRTIKKQLKNMLGGINKPLPEPAPKQNKEALDSLKNASRVVRRRFSSKKKDANGSILVDRKAFIDIPNRDFIKEYNFMHHATKGYRLKSKTISKQDKIRLDSGYSALVLPDLTDKETIDRLMEYNTTPPRHAAKSENYIKKQNVPGGIRRCQAASH